MTLKYKFLLQVNTSLGKWVLQALNVYHPFTGVTTNQSEGFNSALKRFQQWREVPLDSIVLTLYHLQAFFYNEIQRGLAGKITVLSYTIVMHCIMMDIVLYIGLGDFKLLSEFRSLTRPLDEVQQISCLSPEEIVLECLKSKTILNEVKTCTSNSPCSNINGMLYSVVIPILLCLCCRSIPICSNF